MRWAALIVWASPALGGFGLLAEGIGWAPFVLLLVVATLGFVLLTALEVGGS